MLIEQRKLALSLSKRRKDLELPTKRMGELDSAKLHALGVPAKEISLLQQLVTDVAWHPWMVKGRKNSTGEEEMVEVANWDEPKLLLLPVDAVGSRGGLEALGLLVRPRPRSGEIPARG